MNRIIRSLLRGEACLLALLTAAEPLRAEPLSLEATQLFVRRESDLARVVLVAAEAKAGQTLIIESGDRQWEVDPTELSQFMGRLVVPVPPVEQATRVRIRLEPEGRAGQATVEPARRWQVYIVPHTHLDIGFTDLQERVLAALAENLIGVIELCEKTADWPDGSAFRWTIEGTALFENFAKRHPDHVAALVELIRAGQVELTACWANELTELLGPEALVRMLYSARRLSDEHDLRIDTAMLNDVPGYTWSLPQLWSQTGVRYANLRANGIRGKFVWSRPGAVPRPFRWEAPNGSRVLCWYTDSYREANFLRRGFPDDMAAADHPALQRMLYQSLMGHLNRATGTGYDRDVTQLRMGGDNLTAVESVCRWVRYWNERWAFPRLEIATSRQFFHALEQDSRPAPVYRGDIPDWWADGAASSAKQTGQMRIAQNEAAALETLTSLPGGPAETSPTDTFADIYEKLLLYAEHTWGASAGKYERDPEQVEAQWSVKRGYVDDAVAELARQHADWQTAVAGWASPTERSVIVWNTLSWPRSDRVILPADQLPEVCHLRDPSDQVVPAQPIDGDRVCFVARDVPPLGYARYRVVPEPWVPVAPMRSTYKLDFEDDTGRLSQLTHLDSATKLIDTDAGVGFNAYVYEHGMEREKIMPAQLDAPRSPSHKTSYRQSSP